MFHSLFLFTNSSLLRSGAEAEQKAIKLLFSQYEKIHAEMILKHALSYTFYGVVGNWHEFTVSFRSFSYFLSIVFIDVGQSGDSWAAL